MNRYCEMIRKLFFLVLFLFCIITPWRHTVAEIAPAYDYRLRPDGSLMITEYYGTETIVEIPASIDGKAVTSIGPKVFDYCDTPDMIIIPDSVIEIKQDAFTYSYFSAIVCPSSVQSIEHGAFGRSRVYVEPNSFAEAFCIVTEVSYVRSDLSNIKEELIAAKNPVENESIFQDGQFHYRVLADNTIAITGYDYESGGFSRAVDIPEFISYRPVTRIDDYAFANHNLITEVTIPSTVTYIGDYSFKYCESMTTINLPDGLTHLGMNPFAGCIDLCNLDISHNHSYLSLVDDVLFIPQEKRLVFYTHNKQSDYYEIPEGVEYIDDYAFTENAYLVELKMPNSVSKIGSRTFSYCQYLEKVDLPDQLRELSDAFDSCYGLIEIDIPSSVLAIDDYAFYRCTNLNQVQLSQGIEKIGDYAFFECEELTNVIIPDSVRHIGHRAFEGSGLEKIEIPRNVATIDSFAFSRCHELQQADILSHIYELSCGVFFDCYWLKTVELPQSLEIINTMSFCDTDLYSIELPKCLRIIGYAAFNGTSLESLELPEKTEVIGALAFAYTNIQTLEIPDTITEIGDRSFAWCNYLTEATIPARFSELTNSVFFGCPRTLVLTDEYGNTIEH